MISPALDEAAAREIVLVQAFDQADGPLWTIEDSAWASRAALDQVGAQAPLERYAAVRARHAMQWLLPRDPGAGRWLMRPVWRWRWVAAALGGGFMIGALFDHLSSSQRINLLAPPVWAVIGWNLMVYAAVLWAALQPGQKPAGGLQRWLRRRAAPGKPVGLNPLQRARAAWAVLGAPAVRLRIAALLHAGAAALALGMLAAMYAQGLVLDYRAGWQSTFLEAPLVQRVLSTALAPASALTGISVPDVAALRAGDAAAAAGPAAPWLHLYAAMLLLCVIAPRVLLAALALWRAWRASRRVALPWHEPYFQQLRRQQTGRVALVQVLPYAAAPGAQASIGLRAVLAQRWGDEVQLRFAAPTAIGDEDAVAHLLAGAPDLRVALFDLTATPEPDAQGRFVLALQQAMPTVPLLMVVDEAAFLRRFGALPERLSQRRAAWQAFGKGLKTGVWCVDLDQPDLAAIRGMDIPA